MTVSTPLVAWVVHPTGTATSMQTGETVLYEPPVTNGTFGIDLNLDGSGYPQGTYTFNTSTSAPPATGEIRVNNTTPASVTHIYASLTGQPGADLTSLLASYTVGHVLLLQNIAQVFPPAASGSYQITAKSTVGGTYIDFTVTYVPNNVAAITAALSTGAAITSLPVSALSAPVPAGQLTVTSGSHNQTFTTTGAAAGATTIPISSVTPNFAYPSSTSVIYTSATWINPTFYMLCDTNQTATYGTVRTALIRDYFPDGVGEHAKFFDGASGILTSYSHFIISGIGPGANEGAPVFCFKKYVRSELLTLFANMAANFPGMEYWICFWQEMEDDFTKGTAMPAGGLETGPLTIGKWQATWQDIYATRASAGATLCKLVPCLLNYQEQDKRPPGPQWTTFLPIPGVQLDAVGWDTYDAGDRQPTWNFESTYLPKIVASAVACNCDFALTEFGIELSTLAGATDTPALLTARMNAVFTACQAQSNFGWLNYYLDNNQTPHAYPSSYGAQLFLNPSTAMAALQAVIPTS